MKIRKYANNANNANNANMQIMQEVHLKEILKIQVVFFYQNIFNA